MFRSKFLLACVIALGMVAASAIPARAYVVDAGVWLPTNEDVDVFKVKFQLVDCTNPIALYLYDPYAYSPNFKIMDLNSGMPVGPFAQVDFTQDTAGIWTATLNGTTKALTLGTSSMFGLYFEDTTKSGTASKTHEGGDVWKIQDDCATIYLVDANPVPIPGAAWLLGSGLLGLVGLRKRS